MPTMYLESTSQDVAYELVGQYSHATGITYLDGTERGIAFAFFISDPDVCDFVDRKSESGGFPREAVERVAFERDEMGLATVSRIRARRLIARLASKGAK